MMTSPASPDELASLDATAQAELVARGEMTPLELVDAAIARIERLDGELGAVITPLFDKARDAARAQLPDGPFRGVPILLKDIGATSADDPFYCGMGVLKRRGVRAPADSYLTQKLRRAGFVICGKTNTPELGLLPTTEPAAFGATRNPYDRTRTTGGSSGGSAAAVATGMVPLAHANDGGGSIRIPASCCGLVGLKPSRGRTSLGPLIGEAAGGLVIEHVLTRSVRDSAALLDVLSGLMPGDPYAAPTPARPFAAEVGADAGALRIGKNAKFITPNGTIADAHADCVAAVDHAATLLAELGHTVAPARISALEEAEYVRRFLAVWAAGAAASLDVWGTLTGAAIGPADVEPATWALAEMGRTVDAATYINAWAWLDANARRAARSWETDFDLYLTPTVAEPPPPLGTFGGDGLAPIMRAATFSPFTPPFNVSGQPAISLPLYRNGAGLPIGVQLVAAYGREDLLLRVAAALERAQPFDHAATTAAPA